MVYKLVEVEGRPVAKRSENKASRGGRKRAFRRYKPTGTAVEEVIVTGTGEFLREEHDRSLQIPLVRAGSRVPDVPTLADSREHLQRALVSIPWDGLKLSAGEPAIPVVFSS
jgi:nicotinate phosphoribosyltransferase